MSQKSERRNSQTFLHLSGLEVPLAKLKKVINAFNVNCATFLCLYNLINALQIAHHTIDQNSAKQFKQLSSTFAKYLELIFSLNMPQKT